MAFCFIGGGGVGTALGVEIASAYGFPSLFLIYGVMLGITLCLSFFLIKTPGLSPLPVMQAAVELTKERFGELFCLAEIATGKSGFMQSAKDTEQIIIIDGCETAKKGLSCICWEIF